MAVGPSATEGTDDKNTLTVAIRTPFGAVGQNGPTEEIADGNSAAKKGFTTEKTDSVVTRIVKDLSPLLKKDGDGPLHDNGGDKERSSGQDNYAFAEKVDTAGASGVGQELDGKASGQPTPTAAVERFQKIIEQFGSTNGQHDLTVKLDIGEGGERRSRPQGSWPQRHGGGQGVGPGHRESPAIAERFDHQELGRERRSREHFHRSDASGTPDKRDRGETGKQRPQSTPQVDEGFGEFLDVFA